MLENLVTIIVGLVIFNTICGGNRYCYVVTIGVIMGSVLYALGGSIAHDSSLGLLFWGGSVLIAMGITAYFLDSKFRKQIHDDVKKDIKTGDFFKDKDNRMIFWLVLAAIFVYIIGKI